MDTFSDLPALAEEFSGWPRDGEQITGPVQSPLDSNTGIGPPEARTSSLTDTIIGSFFGMSTRWRNMRSMGLNQPNQLRSEMAAQFKYQRELPKIGPQWGNWSSPTLRSRYTQSPIIRLFVLPAKSRVVQTVKRLIADWKQNGPASSRAVLLKRRTPSQRNLR